MSFEEVKLLGLWSSPFVLRVQIAFNIKSIKYQFLQEDLRAKSELLLKANPIYKKVPVLIHGDMSISESLVILEYIDEVWSTSSQILPSDPYDRALARFWASFIDNKWIPSVKAIILSEEEETKKKKIEETIEGLSLLEEAFISRSKGKKFFGGEKIGFIDIALGSCIPWIWAIQKLVQLDLIDDETKTPNLKTWAQHFASNDAIKDVLQDTEKLIKFFELLVVFNKNTQTI